MFTSFGTRRAACRSVAWIDRELRFAGFGRGDRGSASTELVLATPLLMLMLLIIIQFAMWSHATHVAQAAASHGLSAARVHGGTSDAGAAVARRMLDDMASGPLTGPHVHSDRGTEAATVRVTGTASSVIPFLRLPVHAEASGPVERIAPAPPPGG